MGRCSDSNLGVHAYLASSILDYDPRKIPTIPDLCPSLNGDHGKTTLICNMSPRFTYDPGKINPRPDIDGILDLYPHLLDLA